MKHDTYQIGAEEQRRIERFLRGAFVATVLFAAMGLGLFFTADIWLKQISFAAEKRFFDPYAKIAEKHFLKPGDRDIQTYLQNLADRISRAQNLPPEFEITVHYLKNGEKNAFATLGGHVFVLEGLLKVMPDENTLAMVMAHEVAHIKHRDPLQAAGRGLLIGILLSQTGGNSGESVSSVGSQVLLNAYSREQESAADLVALDTLMALYGNAAGSYRLFEVLMGEGTPEDKSLELLSTHPHLESRIEVIKEVIKNRGWPLAEATPLPAEITGAFKE